MCSANTEAFLRELPKCEHHMHLEGALEPELLFRLAAKNGVVLNANEHYQSVEKLEERYKQFTSLDDFLPFFYVGLSVLITEEDFYTLTIDYMTKVHSQGVVHAEIQFAPAGHVARGIPLSVVVAGVHRALKEAETRLGITSELIMCFAKHVPVPDTMLQVEEIIEFVKTGQVNGLGCGSTELGNPPMKYKEVYERARTLGIKNLTMHSGEEGPASWVRSSVEDLGLTRIDHGVRAADDPEVMKLLADRDIFLTLCPLSNVCLRVHKSVAESPIPKFLQAGVKFSINSDDPAYFGGYILENYLAVQDTFNLSRATWKEICTNSINGSWCVESRKQELLALLDTVTAKWAEVEL